MPLVAPGSVQLDRPCLEDVVRTGECVDDHRWEVGEFKQPGHLCGAQVELAGHLVLRAIQALLEEPREPHAPLVGTGLPAKRVLGLDGRGCLAVGELPELNPQRNLQVACNKQTARAADDFDVEIRIILERSSDDRDQLPIAPDALDFRATGLLGDVLFDPAVERPDTTPEGVGGHERPRIGVSGLIHCNSL